MDHACTHDDGRWMMDDGRFACHGVDVHDDDDDDIRAVLASTVWDIHPRSH